MTGLIQALELPKLSSMVPPISRKNVPNYSLITTVATFLAARYLLPPIHLKRDGANNWHLKDKDFESKKWGLTLLRDLGIGYGTLLVSLIAYNTLAIENVYENACLTLGEIPIHWNWLNKKIFALLKSLKIAKWPKNLIALLEHFKIIYKDGREVNTEVDINAIVAHLKTKNPLDTTPIHSAVAIYKNEEAHFITAKNMFSNILKRVETTHPYYDRAQTGYEFTEKVCKIIRHMIEDIEQHPDYKREQPLLSPWNKLSTFQKSLVAFGSVGASGAIATIAILYKNWYDRQQRYRYSY